MRLTAATALGTLNVESGQLEYTFTSQITGGQSLNVKTALDYLLDNSDSTYFLAPLVSAEVSQEGGEANVWKCTTKYKIANPDGNSGDPPTGALVYESDTSGGTAHISTSLETINSYAASGSAPNMNKLIGVQTDGDPQGVDIVVPAFKFSVTKYVAWSNFSQALEDAIANATGYVNKGTLRIPIHSDSDGVVTRTYPDGECLFIGAQIAERPEKNDLAIKYGFIRSAAVEGLTIGGISGISKKGHEYLWIAYKKNQDPTTGEHTSKPQYAYVEKVYGTTNLNGII